MILRHVARAVPQPWRNGGVVTRELLRLPAGAGDDWTLRISVADIEADGPFSAFHDAIEPGPGFGFFSLQPLTLHGAGAEPVTMPALSLAWSAAPVDASRARSVSPSRDGAAARKHTVPGYWIRLLPAQR